MDALTFIREMLSQPVLKGILSDNKQNDYPDPSDEASRDEFLGVLTTAIHSSDVLFSMMLYSITEYETNDRNTTEYETDDDKKVDTIQRTLWFARVIGECQRALQCDSRTKTINSGLKFVSKWKKHLRNIINTMVLNNYLEQTEAEGELEHGDNHDVVNSIDDTKRIQDLFPDKADSSICLTNEEKCRALLLMTAFPGCRELKKPSKMVEHFIELSRELSNLPKLICEACDGQPLSLLLIGGLLSFKPMVYNTWNTVKDDLIKIKESEDDPFKDHTWHIFIPYCYDDLPYLLKFCFLYLACYPIGYEIPARSLTNIWIAEGFVEPEEGETIEETSFKYLEQLVQRFLVCVSKRSFSGTIKCCRVCQSIHEFAIKQSRKVGFLVANPDMEEMRCISRLAIHQDNKNQYPVWGNNGLESLIAFDFDMKHWSYTVTLTVMELRNSALSVYDLRLGGYLSYLGLRGCKISSLPEDIGCCKELQTLDVRDTNIETIPKELWSIPELRHVYVNPNPNFKGPPSTAKNLDLQTLKTVAVHESWQENFPQCLIKLKKLALLNRDNPDKKSNPYWKSISNLLSHMVNLSSMAIIGDIVPSEFVDLRAFPNLETLKSIKFEGKWIYRKLFIDNIKFPPNLTKLTLTKSGLAEDPMPRLEKLKALRYLSLQDGVYMGKKMVCSANGFPHLQILEISELKNLEIWEVNMIAMSQITTLRVVQCDKLKQMVWSANGFPQLQFVELSKLKNLEIWKTKPMAMSQLTTLRVVQCPKLKNLPILEHVTDKVIDN